MRTGIFALLVSVLSLRLEAFTAFYVQSPDCAHQHAGQLLELLQENPHSDDTLGLAARLEKIPECFLAPGSACILAYDLGFRLAAQGHAGGVMPSGDLLGFERWVAKCRAHPHFFEDFEAELRPVHWEVYMLTKKMWTQTSRDVEDFERAVQPLGNYDSLVEPQRPEKVCIRGATFIAQESLVFAHFSWGHLVPVFTAVLRAGYLHRQTQLIFTDDPFMKPRSQWLAFYGTFFDELPLLDTECREATATIQLSETYPIFSRFMEHPERDKTTFQQGPWEDHFALCAYRPLFHRIATARVGIGRSPLPQILYLGRGIKGAVQRKVETFAKRELLNRAEVLTALEVAAGDRAHVRAVNTDYPWHEQVKLFASADFMLGLHGSAIASQEIWMPDGSILVSVMSRSICECRWAYCAAANPDRAFLYVLSTSEDISCDLGGRWLKEGRSGPFEPPELHRPYRIQDLVNLTHANKLWDYTRHVDPTEIAKALEVALRPSPETASQPLSQRFKNSALQAGHQQACGGLALQMMDSAKPLAERPPAAGK